MEKIFSGKYEKVTELYHSETCVQSLIKDIESSNLFVKLEIKCGSDEAYRQLLGQEHINVPAIYQIINTDTDAFSVITEYFDGVTMSKKLADGVSIGEFTDYLLQICDALEFLCGQNPPIFNSSITTENIFIGADNLLKLGNLESFCNSCSVDDAIGNFGVMLSSVDERYIKRYRDIAYKCEGEFEKEYESIASIRKDILAFSRSIFGKYTATLISAFFVFLMICRVLAKLM